MPFNKPNQIPSVKISNKTDPPSTIQLEGYLNKQKHGKCKAWLKRYFVLYGEELRYYKTQNDKTTLAVISLDHYSLVPDAQPVTSLNSKQWKYNTFCLVSDDDTKFDWPDYFLQASSQEERQVWVDTLQKYVAQSTSILEKWLNKVDIPDKAEISSSIYEFNMQYAASKQIPPSLSTSPSDQVLSKIQHSTTSVVSSTIHSLQEYTPHKAIETPIINPSDFDKEHLIDSTTNYYYNDHSLK